MPRDLIGEELAQWGKVALLQTTGRRTGRVVRTAVGYLEEPGDALLVAAGSDDADWVLNLRATPRCRATIGAETREYEARELDLADRGPAITRLILKYGTPAERLGRGPVYELLPRPG